LLVHQENTVAIFSKAISELLRDYIEPDYDFAFRIFASTDNNSAVKDMVILGIRNWNWNWNQKISMEFFQLWLWLTRCDKKTRTFKTGALSNARLCPVAIL